MNIQEQPGVPATNESTGSFVFFFVQPVLMMGFVAMTILSDPLPFKGVGSWVWLALKLFLPAVLVILVIMSKALLSRGGQPYAYRCIGAVTSNLLLFGLLIGPLGLMLASSGLVNSYNLRFGQPMHAQASITSYETSTFKLGCTGKFTFRIEDTPRRGRILRSKKAIDCPAYKTPRRFDGYSDRLVDLELHESWIGTSISHMQVKNPDRSTYGHRP